MKNFFNKNVSASYNELNRGMAPVSINMHFLTGMVLNDLPEDARILCIGVGTGAEIFPLAEAHPEWTFVGVDPSADMLAVCQQSLEKAGIAERCDLIEGYVADAPEEMFDAVVSILVGHFIPKEDRLFFYSEMRKRLKVGGYMINTEISFDFESAAYPTMLENWKQVQLMRGTTPESLNKLPQQLEEILSVLPPCDVEAIMRESGFSTPVPFFQSFMMMGWYAKLG